MNNPWIIALAIIWGSATIGACVTKKTDKPYGAAFMATICMGIFYLLVMEY